VGILCDFGRHHFEIFFLDLRIFWFFPAILRFSFDLRNLESKTTPVLGSFMRTLVSLTGKIGFFGGLVQNRFYGGKERNRTVVS